MKELTGTPAPDSGRRYTTSSSQSVSPPPCAEISEAVGLSSSSHRAEASECPGSKKGVHQKRNLTRSRTIEICDFPMPGPGLQRGVDVPLLGTITAGRSSLLKSTWRVFSLPQELVGDGQLFMLHVRR